MISNQNLKTTADIRQPNKKRHLRCFPTRYGWLLVIALLGMLMGSINYNNNLGFLFTFLLSGMLLVSLVHSYRNIQGITVDTIEAPPVFETQDAIFELKLNRLPRQSKAVRFSLDGSQETVVDTMQGSCARVSIVLPSTKRGRISPRELHIVSEYPLGLFTFHATCQVFTGCLVYPKPVSVQNLSMQDLLNAHSDKGASQESVEDFKGLRAFQNGDATRHIFWKAFSKGQGLMVKEFMDSAAPSVCFCWKKIRPEDPEKKLSLLCGMVLKAQGMKLTYGLRLPGQLIAPGKGEHHKHACLKALALF